MRVETDTDREAVCLRRFNSRHAAAVRSWHKPDLRRTAAVRPKPDPWYAQKSTKSDPELPFSLRCSLTGLARPRPLPQQTGAAAGRYALPKSPSCAPPACDGIATAAKIQTEPSLPEEVPCLRQLRPVRVSLDAQVYELLIGLPDRALVPHERSGTRRAENAAEPGRCEAPPGTPEAPPRRRCAQAGDRQATRAPGSAPRGLLGACPWTPRARPLPGSAQARVRRRLGPASGRQPHQAAGPPPGWPSSRCSPRRACP